jgi:hypothetical protein
MSSHQCPYCPKAPPTAQGLSSHLAQSQRCKEKLAAFYRAGDLLNVNNEPFDEDVEMGDQPVYAPNDPDSDLESNADIGLDPPIVVPMAESNLSGDEGPTDLNTHSRRASVEEVEDEEDGDDVRYINDFAGAGLPHAERCQTNFEQHFAQQREAGDAPWAPFESKDEWELAKWLMTSGVSQKQMDDFLKLKKV